MPWPKAPAVLRFSTPTISCKGLEKVAKEMNEYYNLGYTPPSQTHDGSYHKIKVTVARAGVVRALPHRLL